jgi:hypothetical protein
MSMDIREIQIASEGLPSDQERTLLDWLAERDLRHWDAQIEEDFSEGGAGMDLLDRAKKQIEKGHSAPLHEGRNRH